MPRRIPPRSSCAALLLALAACVGEREAASPRSGADGQGGALEELVSAERAFASDAAALGTRAAFIRHISPAGVLFRPGPVPGLPALEEDPPSAGALSWAPEVARVSADGGLGFTSGPWTFTRDDGGEPATGRYVTLWRRGEDGVFRFELDVGVPGPLPGPFPDAVESLGSSGTGPDTRRGNLAGLLAWDEVLREAHDERSRLEELGVHPRLRVLRPGRLPGIGPGALRSLAAPGQTHGGLIWDVRGSHLSDDGTLGYVYGMAHRAAAPGGPGAPAPFLHIWGREEDGEWRLVLDLLGLSGA